jgi:ABC-type multidrug transport system fused ATPase/permease subunit
MQHITFFLSYFKTYKKSMYGFGFLFILLLLINSLEPIAIQQGIDNGIIAANKTYFFWLIALVLLGKIIANIIQWKVSVFLQRILLNAITGIRNDQFKNMLKKPVSYFDQTIQGQLVSRLTTELNTLMQYSDTLRYFFWGSVITIFTSIVMFQLNFILTLISLCIVPFAFFVFRFSVNKLSRLLEIRQNNRSRIYSNVIENTKGASIIKLFNRQSYSSDSFNKTETKLIESSIVHEKYLQGIISLSSVIEVFFVVIIIWVSAFYYSSHKISIGMFIAFIGFNIALQRNLGIIENSISAFHIINISIRRVYELVHSETAEQHHGTVEVTAFNHTIRFEEVSYAYPNSNSTLHNISFTIQSKSFIVLMGPSGSGKSTCIRLLLQLYQGFTGKINLNETEINLYHLEQYQRLFAVVHQKPVLFTGTILENLCSDKSALEIKEIEFVTKRLLLHEKIMGMKHQYHTRIEALSSFSPGEIQLMSLARAFISGAPIIILDEAFSNLDHATELIVLNAIEQLKEERTFIAISHQFKTIECADQIIVFNHGMITETGSHQELILKNGVYSMLWNIQCNNIVKNQIA